MSLSSKPSLILMKERSTYQGGGQLHTKIFPGSYQQTILEFLILRIWGFTICDDQNCLHQEHMRKSERDSRWALKEERKQDKETWWNTQDIKYTWVSLKAEILNSMYVPMWGAMGYVWCKFNTSGEREWHAWMKGRKGGSGTVEHGKWIKSTPSPKPCPSSSWSPYLHLGLHQGCHSTHSSSVPSFLGTYSLLRAPFADQQLLSEVLITVNVISKMFTFPFGTWTQWLHPVNQRDFRSYDNWGNYFETVIPSVKSCEPIHNLCGIPTISSTVCILAWSVLHITK